MARENEEGAFFCRDNHENYAAVVAIFLEASPDVDASTYHQEEMNNSRVTEFLYPLPPIMARLFNPLAACHSMCARRFERYHPSFSYKLKHVYGREEREKKDPLECLVIQYPCHETKTK